MRGRSQGWRFPFAAVVLVLIAGCVNSKFVYKPNPPMAGGPKLPVKVAVLPFKDGTEDFTERRSIFLSAGTWNLAKTAGKGVIFPALPPDLWAKSFADDMTVSGSLQAVRFIYSASELVGEEFFIEGTLEKAYVTVSANVLNEFALGLRALRRADNRTVWEKKIAREWKNSSLDKGCELSLQCEVDKVHAYINRVMQSMFAEAKADLVETLASLSKGLAGEDRKDKEISTPQAPESVERTIDRILKGK